MARSLEMRSWLGPQPESRHATAPSYSISGKGVVSRPVSLSVGPIYLPSPRGKMGDGPKFSFGSAQMQAEATAKRLDPEPGPGEYEQTGAIGAAQVQSMSHTSPSFGWGTSGRHQAAIGSSPRPACGEFYQQVGSIGRQPTSTKRNVSAFAFGHQPRFDSSNRAANPSASNPGPGSYRIVSATGTQVDSTLTSKPKFGFSRDQRFRPRATTAASEANARLPPPAFGQQVLSDFKSKPSFGFSGAGRFRPTTAESTPGPGSYNA